VFAIPMRQHTAKGGLCYEPFAGSGSQIIAAEMLSRRCFAIEISEQYCDVCVRRWEEFTGKKAERISDAANAPAREKARSKRAVKAKVKS
jgi:DNA modification methylase